MCPVLERETGFGADRIKGLKDEVADDFFFSCKWIYFLLPFTFCPKMSNTFQADFDF